MEGFNIFLKRLFKFPKFLVLFFKDLIKYLKEHRWEKFEGWGLHIYCGKFGAGKTCTMVRDAYNLCCQYKGLTVITNLKLCNFPEDTVIKPLNNIDDILNAPDNTIVLIDEIGTIFNSRDFMGNKESCLPKILFQHLCQCRHRFMMIMGTVQRWGFLDKQLRDITTDVTICSTWPAHPFSRMVTNRCYDADEYNMFFQSPMRPLLALSVDVWVQTDFFRNLYDTKEMVSTMLTQKYVSDEEIARNRAFEDIGIPLTPMDKKAEQKMRKNMRNR